MALYRPHFYYSSIPLHFFCLRYWSILRAIKSDIGGRTITNLRFADDIYALAGKEEELFKLVNQLTAQGINNIMVWISDKTKLVTNNTKGIKTAASELVAKI